MSKLMKPLTKLARTPRPPYYAVSTTTELNAAFDREQHSVLGTDLFKRAHELGGFLGLEVFFENGAAIAVSYWQDLESINRWRQHPDHTHAKEKAKADWFGATITRIARVELDYGFNLEV